MKYYYLTNEDGIVHVFITDNEQEQLQLVAARMRECHPAGQWNFHGAWHTITAITETGHSNCIMCLSGDDQ